MKTQSRRGRSGRPPSEPKTVRHLTIGVRLNASELDVIRRKADRMGIAPTTWMRIAALGRVAPRPPVPLINRQAYADLARLAGNLNQLTRAAHEGRVSAPPALLSELRCAVQKLRLSLLGATYDSKDDQG